MALQIVQYPHPTLRHKSKPIRRVDAKLGKLVREMFELMYEARGVGLAANQVDLPVRLFIANLEAEQGKGQELVFINPVITRPKGAAEQDEGCLSLPEVYGPVKRPKSVHVNAYNLQGEEFQAHIDGLFARVVQHETDHLDGVLFPDRMSPTARADVQDSLIEFEIQFQQQRDVGQIPADDDIGKRLKTFEQTYC